MRCFPFLTAAIAGAALCLATPAPSLADLNEVEQQYLNALYTFLETESPLAYELATDVFTDEENLDYAGVMCAAYEAGYSVPEIITEFFEEANVAELEPTEQEVVAAYLGAIIPASALYYCPEYWPTVEAFMQQAQ